MSHARAAIAGVLAVGVVLLLVFPDPDVERAPERALAAFLGLLVVLGLLLDVDFIRTWRELRRDRGDKQAKVEPDEKEPPA